MPKKDTAAAVMGMLSNVGAQTRSGPSTGQTEPSEATAEPPAPVTTAPPALPPDTRPSATVSALPAIPAAPSAEPSERAPRTIRLRAQTASDLRSAWLEAKRDDVLLQSQDFASTLVEEALAARRRRARSASFS